MGTCKGRRITIATVLAVVALGLLVSAGVAWKDALVEQWHIFRLGSDEHAARLYAAERLAELRSVRALPRLLELIETDERERVARRGGRFFIGASAEGGSTSQSTKVITVTPLAFAVYQIGQAALPAVRNAQDENEGTKRLGQLFLSLQRALTENGFEVELEYYDRSSIGDGRGVPLWPHRSRIRPAE